MLGSKEGRAFLADPHVDPTSRMWAVNQVAADPKGTAEMIKGQEKPWETPAVAQAFARPWVDGMAAARGNEATLLKGGTDPDNFVGASIGAPITATPQTEAEAAEDLAAAAQGRFNFYSGTPAVQKAADGIRAAQQQVGGGDIRVSVLPITFSSQQDGAFNLNLYKVEGANGKSRYVDNIGRVYTDLGDWKQNNGLPPGKMTYPADGKLGAPGQTRLVTEDTPKALSAGWDQFTRGAALVGAAAAGGLLILGTGGAGTPAAVALWAVVGVSATVTGAQALGVLRDRATHLQTLSLSDPEARAAWLSLGGTALTISGVGVGRLAGLAGEESSAAAALARTSGGLYVGATTVNTMATVNSANDLVQNWNQMTPGQRTEAGLQLAFWAGMSGLTALSFRQQMSGALLGIKPNPGRAPLPNLDPDAQDVLSPGYEIGANSARISASHAELPGFVNARNYQGLDYYLSNGYGPVNEHLRTAVSLAGPATTKTPQIAKAIDEMDGLAGPAQHSLITYRGGSRAEVSGYRLRDTSARDAYMSTSRDPAVGRSFAQDGTLFRVSIPEGSHVIVTNPILAEVVLARGTIVKVVGITKLPPETAKRLGVSKLIDLEVQPR
jgi:hypothetical protein